MKTIKVRQGSRFEGKGSATYQVRNSNFQVVDEVKFENINLRATGVDIYINEKLYESFNVDEDVQTKRLLNYNFGDIEEIAQDTFERYNEGVYPRPEKERVHNAAIYVAKQTQEYMLEKAVKFLEEALQEKFDADESSVRMFLVDFKRTMKEE